MARRSDPDTEDTPSHPGQAPNETQRASSCFLTHEAFAVVVDQVMHLFERQVLEPCLIRWIILVQEAHRPRFVTRIGNATASEKLPFCRDFWLGDCRATSTPYTGVLTLRDKQTCITGA